MNRASNETRDAEAAADLAESARVVASPDVGATPGEVVRPVARKRRPGGLPMHESLPRQVWILSKWPMLEQLLAFLVFFVDTTLAGRLDKLAEETTNAVGVAGYAMWFMGLCQGAIGVGATAVIARAIGARHRREATAAVGQAMLLATAVGLVILVGVTALAPWFSRTFELSGRTAELATQYLRILAVAAPAMAILHVGSACLRGAGDFRSSFYVMLIVNAVNIAMSVLFVAAPAPIGGHGIRGIAMGTLIAWVVGCLLMLGLLLRGRGGVRLYVHRLALRSHMMWRIVRIGAPSFLENASMWVGHALILFVIGKHARSLGNEALLGAHTIAIRIESFSFLPGFAFSMAAATMVGQYLGAGDVEMARRAGWACWRYAAAIMTALGVMFMLIPRSLVWIVTEEPEFLTLTPPLLIMAGWAQIGFATGMVLAGAMRGAGDTRTTLLMNLGLTYLVRVPLVLVVVYVFDLGLTAIWFALSLELMLRGVAFAARYVHGGWTRAKV